MASDAFSVEGFVGDRVTGDGLAGLRVELWSADSDALVPLAEADSDGAGGFGLSIGIESIAALAGDGAIEVELRVLDGTTIVCSELHELATHGAREAMQLWIARELAPVVETVVSVVETTRASMEVYGQVKRGAAEGSRVRAVVRTLSAAGIEAEVVGEAEVDAAGWFRVPYECAPSDDATPRSLVLELFGPDGAPVSESMPMLAPPESVRMDLRPPRSAYTTTEHAALRRYVNVQLGGDPQRLAGLDAAALAELAEWVELEPHHLGLLQRTDELAHDTGLAPEVFYALGRAGIPLAFESLVDVPLSELRTTIEESVSDRIVDARVLDDLDVTLGKLGQHALDRAMEAAETSTGSLSAGLGEVLAGASLPKDTIRTVLSRYQRREATTVEFWESLFEGGGDGDGEALGEEVAGELRVAVELAGLVGNDPPLLRRLHTLRGEGRWQSLEDLAGFDFDDWCELLDAEGAIGEDDAEWAEDRAGAILDALEDAFPSAFIRRELVGGEEIGAGARRILERVPDHDFVDHSIRKRVGTDASLIEGLDEEEAAAAIEELEAVERVARITSHPDQVAVLMSTGMHSAHAIAQVPARQFGDLFGEALGGRAQAANVHAQAQQQAAAGTLAMVQLLQALQQTPLVLGGGVNSLQTTRDQALKEMPELRELFGSIGSCGCEHCSSVYSPAAYFIDLLRYLDISDPKRLEEVKEKLAARRGYTPDRIKALSSYRPLDVLLDRRPDLADIPLTCENTLTPLPYIDLVNEVLEARIVGGNAAHDTGKVPADVLRAVPQFVNRDAYRQLQGAVFPATLPFHEPLAMTRAYLGHLGVQRADLLRRFRREGGSDELLAERLGMSTEELGFVARAPEQPWRHFGLQNEQGWVEALAHVPAFLHATAISFQELIDLVATRFLNRDDTLVLESSAPDCDPAKVRIVGLDAERLVRMIRLLRLRRRLGWSFADLDRALVALGATDLDATVLGKLVEARDLAKRLDRPIVDLLGLWAPIDTTGDDSLFARLLRTRAVAWRTNDASAFKLKADRSELEQTADSLDPVAPALLAAFRITNDDLATARSIAARGGGIVRLDLAGLSAVYRVALLARALRLRVDQLEGLLRLVPPDADPFAPRDPAATRRFVDIADEVAASEFTPERLVYLFRPDAAARRDPGPTPAQVESVLAAIRRALADAFTETALPTELTVDVLRSKLAMLLDPALVDQAVQALDPRARITVAERRAFFDRHLARIFPDAAAAAPLFVADPAPATTRSEAEPTPAAPTAAPDPAAEQRLRANIQLVLHHLLPLLRAHQMRGAVVQALADTLGTTGPSTARLVESLLRSRRSQGRPIVHDFYALVGTGLTGAYFADAEARGEPVVTRIDPRLDFSWAGAVPADGVPATRFAVRWTGRFLPRVKAPHTFYVATEGAVRIAIVQGGSEQVVLDVQAGANRVTEHASRPIELDPKELAEIVVEYRNAGGAASFAMTVGTTPSSKQPIATTQLYPRDGLASFAPVADSYRRLHKAAMLLTGFGVTDEQLAWLTAAPARLDLDALPMDATQGSDTAVASFQRWRQLAAAYAVRKRLSRASTDLFEAFRAIDLPSAIDRIVAATGWEKAVVTSLLGPEGLAADLDALGVPPDPSREPTIVRLDRAVSLQRRIGVAPQVLFAWASAPADADIASAIVQVVKARYDEKRWLDVAQSLNDPLRAQRRDALVEYLLPRMRAQGVANRNHLFEFFLIDVEMNPCMMTSRIKQAISAVQTFFQRCLMSLESRVPPRLIDENDWKWLKSYRMWEANRKVFLYPENWIEPELRDDKSPIFQELERTILQQEIKKENVESAFIDYLQRLDEVSRLDVRAVWYDPRAAPAKADAAPTDQRPPAPPAGSLVARWDGGTYRSHWDDGTYHVFARTFDPPHVWFYRRLDKGRIWTPWEKIDADIEGDHLVPLVYQRRLYLFWTIFREVNKPAKDPEKDAAPYKLGKDHEIGIAYSVYDRGRWSRKRMSSAGVTDAIDILFSAAEAKKIAQWVTAKKKEGKKPAAPRVEGSAFLPKGAYSLRASVSDEQDKLQIFLYRRAVDWVRVATTQEFPKSGGELLSVADLELVASFALDGCNGELDVRQHAATARVTVRPPTAAPRRSVLARIGTSRRKQPLVIAPTAPTPTARPPFQLASGGRVDVPPGYRVDGPGYTSTRTGATTLALAPVPGRGVAQLLGHVGERARLVPVVDPTRPHEGGVFPFFFQDRRRCWFVRPTAAWLGARRLTFAMRARPLVGVKAVPHFGRKHKAGKPAPGKPAPGNPARGKPGKAPRPIVRGRRESIESAPYEVSLARTARTIVDDARDDRDDEAWHPDDAAERRQPQRTRRRSPAAPRPPTPAQRPVPMQQAPVAPTAPAVRTVHVDQAAHYEWKLRFTPFEHPDTCRLIRTLKSSGLEKLFALETTRPTRGRDHDYDDKTGRWVRKRPSTFARKYKPGPLADSHHPHLDIDFAADNPYSLYNWELFFHAPLQVAIRLAKDGRHEEAQRWFHFIFDPTSDGSAPAPHRYWNFAPFHENREYDSARELMALLSYRGDNQSIIARQNAAHEQVSAWWEKPFSPHVIARQRISAYQKAVVMKYIDNVIEWGDKLFRRDTMETIQEATQLYILAGNILGPRPETVPPMVKPRPATFRDVRGRLDVFGNWAVRFENDQVRRPFRINATPDTSGVSSVLGMATQYFCIPGNPQLDKYWDTVADRLHKIRNCMNIKGVVRQLALFEPPLDPGMLVRAAAAGVDLGSVAADLNAPPPNHRFRFLFQRAVVLADEVRRFGEATVKVLERRDAEALATLRESHETGLLEAIRDIGRTKIKQIEEEVAWLALEREHVELQMQHVLTLAQTLMNPQENARQSSLTASQVISGVAEGVDLVSKVLYAIPDFQAGVAGGFSSPFTTLQLGGQMFGDISNAVASSMFKIMNKYQTEAEMAEAQAEYQRRQEELLHEHELLSKEKEKITRQIGEINLKLEIHNAELRRHDVAVENSRKVEAFMREKYTNEQLYGWMLGQLSGAYFQAYKLAFDSAKLAERAMRFERGDPSAQYIEFSYWDSLKKGLYAGERLSADLRRMEAAALEGDARALEITRHVSLREDHPAALQELIATGSCKLDVTEALLDGDFPGHYFRRIKTVKLSILGGFAPHTNVNCTVTLLANRIRTVGNASGSYPQSEDDADPRFLQNLAPIASIAASRPTGDPGVFELRLDDDRYLPFEGAGAISTWRIELRQADNAVDLMAVTDVVLSMSYTARSGGAPLEVVARASREKGLSRGGLEPPPRKQVSVRRDLPELWKKLAEAPVGQDVQGELRLDAERFSGRYRGHVLRLERMFAYVHPRGELGLDALRLRLQPPKGSETTLQAWTRPWSNARTLRADAEVAGAPGEWKLAITAQGGKVPDLVDDIVLVFDVRARKT